MKVAGLFSFAGGEKFIRSKYPDLFKEIEDAIDNIDASLHQTKKSKEKTMQGRTLFSPKSLNNAFKKQFFPLGWNNRKIKCEYSTNFYLPGYTAPPSVRGAFRDMDFVKQKLGVEVQFGKYSFMVYNVCAKMTIFKNLGFIDAGVEIVPTKKLAKQMSSGVSYFEQFVWDLQQRGESNIDVPTIILGIDQ